jgi:hypothetical protein
MGVSSSIMDMPGNESRSSADRDCKKQWSEPKLQKFGRVSELTAGGSVPANKEKNPMMGKPGTFKP